MESICVYTGASPGVRPSYAEAARKLATELAVRGITMVYGGGHVGLMGVAADAALQAGGRVIGVIPQDIADRENQHLGLTELYVVDHMHERKMTMTRLSAGMIALPGGLGTMEELFEVWTWNQLGFHRKPVGLLNIDGYYDGLLAFLDNMVAEGFVREQHRDLLLVETEPAPLLERMRDFCAMETVARA